MKKRVYGRKLSQERDSRRALFRSLIRALVEHGKITTTKAKAKAIQASIDKLVNLSKQGSISAKRRLYALLGNDKKTTKTLLEKIAPAFSDRKGGYTRIIALPRRRGDAAEIARIEWVKSIIETTEKPKAKGKEKSKKKKESVKKVATKKKSNKKK
ncbi:MAG: 50S ribosomal protein L17 [Microgenomates group bacterium]